MRAKVLASLRPHLTSLLTLEGLLLAVSSQCTAITPLGASCTATFTNSGSSGSRGIPYGEISSGVRLSIPTTTHHCCRARRAGRCPKGRRVAPAQRRGAHN